ncbi:hypothetical protein RintRC_2364 [Richelia intracellularis]|nr:hypothetical protein RintRC_2364 [Richelia intracellularis]
MLVRRSHNATESQGSAEITVASPKLGFDTAEWMRTVFP